MFLLAILELLVIVLVVSEVGIPAVRGTKFFPMIRSLRLRRKLSEVKTEIDNDNIDVETESLARELKKRSTRKAKVEHEKFQTGE